MGRTARTTAEDWDAAAGAEDLAGKMPAPQTQKLEQAGTMLVAEDLLRDLLAGGAADALIAVGRIQAATVSAKIADTLLAQAYASLVKSGGWRGIPYRKTNGDGATVASTVASLEEFCQVYLGRSTRRCQQLSANLHTLGADLYEAAEAAGFRQRDYSALKALPADDREAVKLALEAEDKDKAIEVLSDLVTRQEAHKAAAQEAKRKADKERDEARQDYAAATQLLGQAKAQIRRYQGGTLAPPPMDEQMAGWPRAVGALIGEMRANLARIGILIGAAEREIGLIAPQADTPEFDTVQRACALFYDGAGPALSQLNEEVLGVLAQLDRTVGVFAVHGTVKSGH